MRISVIIPTLNRLDDLKSFVRSLEKQSILPHELIIVDQSSDGRIKEYANQYAPKASFAVKYVFTEERSLTRAKNLGILHLDETCKLVAFFDDDIVLFPDYLQEMNVFFEKDEDRRYAVATGMIHPEGIQHGSAWSLRSLVQGFDTMLCKCFVLGSEGDGHFKINGLPAYIRETKSARDVEVMSGGVSVFRKEILERFKFDGNMRTYGYMEDVDMGYRISRQYKNAFLPSARVYHRHSATSRLNESTTKSHFIQNYIYLFRKNLPKNMLTFLAFVWSIIGLFFVAALEFRGSALAGYADGLFKGARGRFDSLYPDWQENMHLYES